jgi:hypothetical protein
VGKCDRQNLEKDIGKRRINIQERDEREKK